MLYSFYNRTLNRVPTVREKSVKNEKSSRYEKSGNFKVSGNLKFWKKSGKSQGIL